jgi:Xaa-Pro dipeptidase
VIGFIHDATSSQISFIFLVKKNESSQSISAAATMTIEKAVYDKGIGIVPTSTAPSIVEVCVQNRQRLVKEIARNWRQKERNENGARATKNGGRYDDTIVVWIRGGASAMRYDSDHEPIFRQESYFFYLTGVKEPDCALRLCIPLSTTTSSSNAKDDTTNDDPSPPFETTLYVPQLPPEYATIMGPIRTREEWKSLYLVDRVTYIDENENKASFLSDFSDGNATIHLMLMKGRNADSGTMYEPPAITTDGLSPNVSIDTETLFPILADCRVIKSNAELYWLRFVTEITSFAHTYVMRNFRAGMYEYQAESLFRHYCHYNYGARLTGYTPICACGPSSAILHYGHAGEPNGKLSPERSLCLFDMGAEYCHYGSDVTCTFPSSGCFTPKQRIIYEAVLNAQRTVYAMMRPGVSWVDCHLAAEATILTALIDADMVHLSPSLSVSKDSDISNKTVAELVEMRMGAVFMPHGLGHFIGLDTHDVGGYLPGHPERSPLPGLAKLRTARLLQADMVLTVEPGCYFIDHLLDAAMADDSPLRAYLNVEKINSEYRGFGGVRLEDVVQVTATGMVNYTLCPRTVAEVESVLAGGKWPPTHDAAPELRRLRLTDTTPLPPPPSF